MNRGNVYSVSSVNQYIKNMFSKEYALSVVFVKGEISNCKYHSSGHIYFSLKDDRSQLTCVMFRGDRGGLDFRMENGQEVVVGGSISVYERDGKYQLYAKKIVPVGDGHLQEQYEKLKKKLEAAGYFDEDRKLPIPKYVKKVGIVTARTGAAVHDMIQIATRRNPYVQLYLYPAKVQGEGAAQSIAGGISFLDEFGVDVILAGRGGGSMEDLWAFNEECVAMAIFRCETPVISAVGHETDFTIADFVADLRAPTPSAAAELAVFEYDTFENTLNLFAAQLSQSMQALIESRKKELEHAKLSLKVSHPSVRLKAQSETLKQYEAQIKRQIMHLIDQKKAQLSIAAAKLEAQSPLKKVGGGYAFLTDENKKPVCSVNQMTPQTTFFAYLSDGIVQADVTKCMPKDKME